MAFTSRSVNLSWTPPLNSHNSPVSHYLIHVRVGEDGEWDDESAAMLTETNATVYQVTNLQPFTTYSFRVTAVNGMGQSGHSKESYYMLTLREGKSNKLLWSVVNEVLSTALFLQFQAAARPSLVRTTRARPPCR